MLRGTNWSGLAIVTAAGLGAGVMLGALAGEYVVSGTDPISAPGGYTMPAHVIERDGAVRVVPAAAAIDTPAPVAAPALS